MIGAAPEPYGAANRTTQRDADRSSSVVEESDLPCV